MEKITLTHTLYGAGEQVSLSDTVIRVRFADGTERSFVYPDAFLKFLTYTDDARERAVRALLPLQPRACGGLRRRARLRRVHHVAHREPAQGEPNGVRGGSGRGVERLREGLRGIRGRRAGVPARRFQEEGRLPALAPARGRTGALQAILLRM